MSSILVYQIDSNRRSGRAVRIDVGDDAVGVVGVAAAIAPVDDIFADGIIAGVADSAQGQLVGAAFVHAGCTTQGNRRGDIVDGDGCRVVGCLTTTGGPGLKNESEDIRSVDSAGVKDKTGAAGFKTAVVVQVPREVDSAAGCGRAGNRKGFAAFVHEQIVARICSHCQSGDLQPISGDVALHGNGTHQPAGRAGGVNGACPEGHATGHRHLYIEGATRLRRE